MTKGYPEQKEQTDIKPMNNEDLEFLRWLDSEEGDGFWEKDANGEKVILRTGWDKARAEYERLKKASGNKVDPRPEENRA